MRQTHCRSFWAIEEDLAVLVDLAEAMEHACDFNRWEDLV